MDHTEQFNETIKSFLNNIRQASKENHYNHNSEITEITICMGRSHTNDDISIFQQEFAKATKGTEFEQANLNLKQYIGGGFDPMANAITLEEAKLIIPKFPVHGFPSNPKEKTLSF